MNALAKRAEEQNENETQVTLLRKAGVIYSTLDSVWKAIVMADVSHCVCMC